MIESPAFHRYLSRRLAPLRIAVDAGGRIAAVDGAAEVYGYERCETGMPASEALPFLHGLEQAGALELPMVRTPSGRRAHVMLNGDAAGSEVLMVDATAEWRQQRELQQKANELELLSQAQQRLVRELEAAQVELARRRDEAEQASRLKSEFIARMSHEFRTPLTAIIGHARRLAPAAGGPIARAAVHLLNLVENLLDEAQLRAGRVLVQARPTDLRELVAELEEVFAPLAADKALTFELVVGQALPPRLEIDDLRLRQILINVIGNALKYTERGAVRVALDWRDDRLEVQVVDQGPGIPPLARERLFRPFQRASSSATGAGLGLTISRSLAQLMGGEIALDSTPGAGTTVTLSLPAPRVRALDAGPAQAARVLLAEDSFEIAELLLAGLTDAGYRPRHCASAGEALAVCNELPAPDLVVVDRNLSDMTGFELSRALRAAGFSGPVVMLTASNLLEDRERALAAGCDEFLVKSAGLGALLDSVRRLLEGHD